MKLRSKLLLPALVIGVLLGGLLSVVSAVQIRGMLMEQLQSEGEAACLNLANTSSGILLNAGSTNDLDPALKAAQISKGVAYAYIEDAAGEVLNHTFKAGFPPSLHGVNRLAPGSSSLRTKPIQVRELDLEALDLAAPLLGGTLGTAHLGLDLQAVRSSMRLTGLISMAQMLLLLAVAGALIWWQTGRVLKPVASLTLAVERINKEGDLRELPASGAGDEIGRLSDGFSAMVIRLREVPLSLKASVRQLGEVLAGLEVAVEHQNRMLTLQASALQQTQVTAQELRQNSQMAQSRANDVLAKADQAEAIGSNGEAAVSRSLESMTGIREQTAQVASRIADLAERTRQIGSITETVKSLADQSNMLALNAAIEAVRSGEHGKGFSLVAREIRSLADQSITATRRVQDILESVGQATRQARGIAVEGAQRADEGMQLMRASGDDLRALAAVVQDNSTAVRQIASAISQQDSAVNQIFSAVTDQNRMMEETVQQLQATSEAVHSLRRVFADIEDVIQGFKV